MVVTKHIGIQIRLDSDYDPTVRSLIENKKETCIIKRENTTDCGLLYINVPNTLIENKKETLTIVGNSY